MIRKSRSLTARFVVFYVVLTIAIASAYSIMVFRGQLELIAENATLQAELVGGRLFAELNGGIRREELTDTPRVADLAGRVGLPGAFTLAAYDEHGNPLAAYREGERVVAVRPDMETEALIVASLTGMTFARSRYVVDLDVADRSIVLFVPAETVTGDRFVTKVTLRLRGPLEALARMYRQIILVATITIVLNGAFGVYLSLRVFAPLLRLQRAIEEISTGSFAARVEVDTSDEIGRVGRAVNRMAESLERLHLEARWANPLTGLPGNPGIERAIADRLRAAEPFAMLYLDLDNFKAFNDRYGYARGDKAILFTSDCIQRAQRLVAPEAFVGHEGGDDFVLLCDLARWKDLAEEIIRQFDGGIAALYDEADRRAGWIVALDRERNERRFPIISASIAVVTSENRTFSNPGQVAASVAELKPLAKQRPHSNYVVERRT